MVKTVWRSFAHGVARLFDDWSEQRKEKQRVESAKAEEIAREKGDDRERLETKVIDFGVWRQRVRFSAKTCELRTGCSEREQ